MSLTLSSSDTWSGNASDSFTLTTNWVILFCLLFLVTTVQSVTSLLTCFSSSSSASLPFSFLLHSWPLPSSPFLPFSPSPRPFSSFPSSSACPTCCKMLAVVDVVLLPYALDAAVLYDVTDHGVCVRAAHNLLSTNFRSSVVRTSPLVLHKLRERCSRRVHLPLQTMPLFMARSWNHSRWVTHKNMNACPCPRVRLRTRGVVTNIPRACNEHEELEGTQHIL